MRSSLTLCDLAAPIALILLGLFFLIQQPLPA